MKYLKSLYLLFLCIAFLTACAYRDEGEIDYRKAGSNLIAIENYQGKTIHLAKLEDKNKQSKNTFMEGDRMTMRLTTVFIEDYTEGQIRPRGEIAVLVNVVPREEKEYSFNFSEDAHNQAQVAFYSDDVVAGQFLTFNNMLIYGSNSQDIKNGVDLKIWIIKLNTSTPIVEALLGKMAQSFKSSNGSGSQILKELGGSLISASGTSDTNFLYQASFVPPNSKNMKPLQAPLEVGNYVFIRAPKRVTINNINWAELRLDENSGRLYKCSDIIFKIEHEIEHGKHKHRLKHSNGKCKEYRDNNYLVIQINKKK